jgi:hypothetical protein
MHKVHTELFQIMLITGCDCVRCSVCSVRCADVWHSNSCSVLQFAAERTAVSGSAAVCAAVCTVVCGCPAVRVAVCGFPAVRQCATLRQ